MSLAHETRSANYGHWGGREGGEGGKEREEGESHPVVHYSASSSDQLMHLSSIS